LAGDDEGRAFGRVGPAFKKSPSRDDYNLPNEVSINAAVALPFPARAHFQWKAVRNQLFRER
jgi:hypothetical protein